jgi:hypothetical protein
VPTQTPQSLLPTATITPTGKEWERTNTTNALSARSAAASAELGGKVYVIAGRGVSGPVSDVWFSTENGDGWFTGTAAASFPAREKHSVLSYDNKIWVIAGSNTEKLGDVWCSENGLTWTAKTGLAAFGRRNPAASFSFAGKMWVAGGEGAEGLYNDVWYSKDGSKWEKAKDNNDEGYSKRTAPAYCIYKGKMWIIAGDSGVLMNDVWYSENGSEWKAATKNAEFSPRRGAKAVVYRDRLWLLAGGVKDNKQLADVWWTDDGIKWRQATGDAAFGARLGFLAIAFKNKLVVTGGILDSEIKGDGWYCR